MSYETAWKHLHMSEEEREEAYYDQLEIDEEFGSLSEEQAKAIGEWY